MSPISAEEAHALAAPAPCVVRPGEGFADARLERVARARSIAARLERRKPEIPGKES